MPTGRRPIPKLSKPKRDKKILQNAFKIVFCRENVSFSTIVFFETVLMGVRNRMKNVFA
jgi:hypothetical protein